MSFFIGIADLAANALICVLSRKEEKRFLTYGEIESYGNTVVEILNNQNEKAVLVLSRARTNQMLHDYSDFFEEQVVDGKRGIKLAEGKTVDNLIEKFHGYLAFDLLKAFFKSYEKWKSA